LALTLFSQIGLDIYFIGSEMSSSSEIFKSCLNFLVIVPTESFISQTTQVEKTRKNAIVDAVDYHIPVTQLKGVQECKVVT